MVAVVNAFEQFSYGLGSAAYTVYLITTVRPEYKASHYAIATGVMALGLMIPGNASGFLTSMLGYSNYFLFSFLVSIPGIITILFLPFKETMVEPEEAGG
jgi:PAT family beta-lactamase induction signal transducer AmpG